MFSKNQNYLQIIGRCPGGIQAEVGLYWIVETVLEVAQALAGRAHLLQLWDSIIL